MTEHDNHIRRSAGLSAVQLAGLDLLITVAQENGRGLVDKVEKTEEWAQAVADRFAPNTGIALGIGDSDHDRVVLDRIREAAGNLESSLSLGELLEVRANAVRASRPR